MIRHAIIVLGFFSSVAFAQSVTSANTQQSCVAKCGQTADSCQDTSQTDQGDAKCAADEVTCDSNCAKAEKNACVAAANKTHGDETRAARVAFRTKAITVDHALKAAVAAGGNAGKMFPGLQKVRDDAIKAANTKHTASIAKCK